MTKSRRKVLSPREQEKADAKRQAHLHKRSEAAERRWQRENIAPISERLEREAEEPDDIRYYPPRRSGEGADGQGQSAAANAR